MWCIAKRRPPVSDRTASMVVGKVTSPPSPSVGYDTSSGGCGPSVAASNVVLEPASSRTAMCASMSALICMQSAGGRLPGSRRKPSALKNRTWSADNPPPATPVPAGADARTTASAGTGYLVDGRQLDPTSSASSRVAKAAATTSGREAAPACSRWCATSVRRLVALPCCVHAPAATSGGGILLVRPAAVFRRWRITKAGKNGGLHPGS
jgi:hypothetical protein